MKLLLALLALALAGPALAVSACERAKNDFDGLNCLNKRYQQADAELNAAYKALVAKLDVRGREMLRQNQLRWMAERNASCTLRQEEAFFIDLDCARRVTSARTRFLKDRAGECIRTGCMNDRL